MEKSNSMYANVGNGDTLRIDLEWVPYPWLTIVKNDVTVNFTIPLWEDYGVEGRVLVYGCDNIDGITNRASENAIEMGDIKDILFDISPFLSKCLDRGNPINVQIHFE